MKIVNVEYRVYDMMLSTMVQLANKISKLPKISKSRSLSDWIDGQEVCEFLHIKPRTLQNLRTNGNLAHTQIGRKFFYRLEDAMSLVSVGRIGKN